MDIKSVDVIAELMTHEMKFWFAFTPQCTFLILYITRT